MGVKTTNVPEKPGSFFLKRPAIVYLCGLLAYFVGNSLLGSGLALIGIALMVVAWFLSAPGFLSAKGDERKTEMLLQLAYVGGLIAVVGHQWTSALVQIVAPDKVDALGTVASVLWAILLAITVIPLVMMEASRGWVVRKGENRRLEGVRIREMAASGLSVGLALSFLVVTCHVSNERNIRKDVSYFKTSTAGEAAVNMVSSLEEDLRVLLFYPDPNEVKEELLAYFGTLAEATGKVEIEVADREANPELAKEHKVTADGTIVFVYKDKSEKFNISDDMKRAKGKQLRTLDSTVQKSLFKVIRAKRIAYLTTGHGELNSPDTVGALDKGRLSRPKATLIKTLLQRLNYQVKDLAPFDLASSIPEDATMVISLAPLLPFSDEEKASIDTYLSGGGAMLLALDPAGEADIAGLEGRLGVRYVNTPLADDKEYMPQRMNKADHAFMKTNQFSSHASVTTLSRRGAKMGMLLIRPGYLQDAAFEGGGKPKRTYVVRTMNTAFADENGDFLFTEGSEKRTKYNVAAAIEDDEAGAANAKEGRTRPGMRVFVVADGEVFSDPLLVRVPLLQDLSFDALNWLGGEESFAGETETEEDIKIEHTKKEDKLIMFFSLVGVPLLVLIFGIIFVGRSRRRRTA